MLTRSTKSRSRRVPVMWKAWKADPTMKNDGRVLAPREEHSKKHTSGWNLTQPRYSTPGGNSGLWGHGASMLAPLFFATPWIPEPLKKAWGEPHGTPVSSVGKLAHPRSVSEESLRESQRKTGNRQPPVCAATHSLNRALPTWGCAVTNIKRSVTNARAYVGN